MQPRGREFAEVFARAEPIPGWLTEDQARCLYDAVGDVPPGGTVVEIGSHLGRSAVVLASALPKGARLVCIDPFLPDWRYGRDDTRQTFLSHVTRAGVADRVELRAEASRRARDSWHGPVDLVYVDGAHDPWHAWDDLRWAREVRPGGVVLVHDSFSSVGVTTALMTHALGPSWLRYVGRVGSLAYFQAARPTWESRARMLRELPWFVRNVGIKVLLRLRLRGLASRLGHGGPEDPY